MNIVAKSRVLTPERWRSLNARRSAQVTAVDPLLFLAQGVFHDLDIQGFVKLRTVQELPTSDALITVHFADTEETLSGTVTAVDARLYAGPHDIIYQNDAFHSLIFKILSYEEGAAVAEIYLWEIPTVAAPDAVESDIALSLPKGSTLYLSQTEEDIVMDRTLRVSEDRKVAVNIRTVEGRSYSTTVSEIEAIRCAVPGDYYVENGSDELSIVYGITTRSQPPHNPIIRHIALPAAPGSSRDPGC